MSRFKKACGMFGVLMTMFGSFYVATAITEFLFNSKSVNALGGIIFLGFSLYGLGLTEGN